MALLRICPADLLTDCHVGLPTGRQTRNDMYLVDLKFKLLPRKMWGYNFFIYILKNKNNTVLYTGVTNDLRERVYQHKEKLVKGFTHKYNVDRLVYYERFSHIDEAIAREKQIKSGSRQKKIDLINSLNPEWADLYNQV